MATTGSARFLPGTVTTTLALATLLILIALAAFAWNIARADANGETINACITPNGDVRIIEEGQSCRPNETAVQWNQQGQPGPQGDPGPPGPQGPTGDVDVDVHLVSEADPTAGTSNFYLKIDNIDGESSADGHENEIDVLSWSWGAENNTGIGSGSGGGKANFQDLTITKITDKASTQLVEALLQGRNIQEATLTIPRTLENGEITDYLEITLENVIVSGYDVSQDATAYPIEIVTLDFQIVHMTYYELLSDGSTGPAQTVSWDRATSTAP